MAIFIFLVLLAGTASFYFLLPDELWEAMVMASLGLTGFAFCCLISAIFFSLSAILFSFSSFGGAKNELWANDRIFFFAGASATASSFLAALV